MKKFLEVLMDENGEFHFSTDMQFPPENCSAKELKEIEKLQKSIIRCFTEHSWKTKDPTACKAIRMLSIAEIMADSQPYQAVEFLWSAMMLNDFIKENEKWVAEIKKKYGFDNKGIIRPMNIIDLPLATEMWN